MKKEKESKLRILKGNSDNVARNAKLIKVVQLILNMPNNTIVIKPIKQASIIKIFKVSLRVTPNALKIPILLAPSLILYPICVIFKINVIINRIINTIIL